MKKIIALTMTCILISIGGKAIATEQVPNYSPYAHRDFPENLYWGDTHLHTRLSADAYTFNTRISPEDAYRFARGETILSNTGQSVRMQTPLDFIVISDHAAFLGAFSMLEEKDPVFAKSDLSKRWLKLYEEGKKMDVVLEFINAIAGNVSDNLEYGDDIKKHVWHQVTALADKYNEPGKFTAFIGYEWTSMPNGRNLHRNMVFRDGASKADQILPFTSLQSQNPEDLWQQLSYYESKTGGRVLAIPHNGNVSNGLMFSDKTFNGEQLTVDYAKTRARWEPIVEVTQIKGDGEAHPFLSPDDEFADFETWDKGNLGMNFLAKAPWMLKHEYARSALKLGLELEAQLGVNPYKFGMIGSTDSHTGLTAIEENNFFGKFGKEEPSPTRLTENLLKEASANANYTASGFAAVWAQENTRKALFDAMQRKETYATTGPRIMVRFFGGWQFERLDDLRPDYARIGYQKGVPMGGDLSQAPNNITPKFLVLASKEAEGANLDRIQIIKGWLDENNQSHEKIYNVALSDNRQVNPITKQVTPLAPSVNLANATYHNSVGAVQLSTVWQDPDFNPEQKAFYYARVLEIATPRWTSYDATFFGVKRPDTVPAVIQERAYTSPIWYTP